MKTNKKTHSGKYRIRKGMEWIAVTGIVCLLYGMVLTGTMYYMNPYELCSRQWPASNQELSAQQLEAEFYTFRMFVLQGDDGQGAMASMQASAHTNEIGHILHMLYCGARIGLWLGVLLCVAGFLFFRTQKQYPVIQKGLYVTCLVPVVAVLSGLVWKPDLTVRIIKAVVLSRYALLFHDDAAFVSILPGGIFLAYLLAGAAMLVLLMLLLYLVFCVKRKHRMPHEF